MMWYYHEGKFVRPIKVGDPKGFEKDIGPDYRCHDCGAKPGEYHAPGCDMERCPVCHGQLLACDCFNTKLIYVSRISDTKIKEQKPDGSWVAIRPKLTFLMDMDCNLILGWRIAGKKTPDGKGNKDANKLIRDLVSGFDRLRDFDPLSQSVANLPDYGDFLMAFQDYLEAHAPVVHGGPYGAFYIKEKER